MVAKKPPAKKAAPKKADDKKAPLFKKGKKPFPPKKK